MHVKQITLSDGSVTPIRMLAPEETPERAVVMWPGFGMRASYYLPLAEELVQRGCAVALAELHGQGGNTAVATRRSRFGYHQMASDDYPAAVAATREHFSTQHGMAPDAPVYLLCHSMAGQVAACYLARPDADVAGAVFAAAGAPYYPCFSRSVSRKLRFGTVWMAVLSAIRGYWPAGRLDVMNYGRQSARHILEWAAYTWTGVLRPRGADLDYPAAMARATTPILGIALGGDDLCPPASTRHLLEQLPDAPRRLEIEEEPLGHNRWARQPHAVAGRALRFFREVEAGAFPAEDPAPL